MINQTTANQTNNSNAFQLSHDAPSSFHLNRNADIPQYAFGFTQPQKAHKHFHVIGNERQVKFGAWYCEGLTHALAIHSASGDGKLTLSNINNLPVVMCDNGNLKSVVLENLTNGYDDLRIVADVNHPTDAYRECKSFRVNKF